MYDSPEFSSKIEKSIDLHETSKLKLFEQFGVQNFDELDKQVFQPALKELIESRKWNFEDKTIAANKIVDLLNQSNETLNDEEKSVRDHILWTWYQNATIIALREYDFDKAGQFLAKTREYTDQNNDITQVLEYLLKGKIDTAENYAKTLIRDPEQKHDALEIIHNYLHKESNDV